MTDDTFEILTQDEAAKIARCTPRYLQRKRAQGTGPTPIMFGNRVRYEKTAFLAWLKGQGRALTADTGQK